MVVAGTLVFLSAAFPASAIIDAVLQMQLGNPSGASVDPTNHNHYLIQRTVEAIDYNDNHGQPNWVSWDLTAADIGNSGRTDAWAVDTSLPASFYQVPISPFSGSGYDRGHMCPSADRTDTVANNELVFIMSNIIPQASLQNQNIWANFENYCRQTLLPGGKELLIICGPSLFTTNRLNNNHVTVPGYTWKIVVVVPGGTGAATNRIDPNSQVVAVRIPNTDAVAYDPWQIYRTNTIAIEADTGFKFFTALPPNLATVLRNKIDGQTPPAPAISNFSPGTGLVNSTVIITGTNFVFATNVTFNGANAAFTIDSTAQLTATVPAGIGTGPIQVMTLGGNATSTGNFTPTSSAASDLAINVSHASNFTQGDADDTYTLIVNNIGTTASTGIVTVVDTLPAGLTAKAISGDGWTPNLGTLTCTRSDALAAGAAYPPITVTVSVAANAAASVTNTATISGGGDSNAGNNTASDPTVINSSGSGGSLITLVGWDVSGLSGGTDNFGVSPLSPTTNAANLTAGGLTRGSGIGTSGSGAARGWGGNTWTNTSSATAISSNRFVTFNLAANSGYRITFASISRFDYRRSATGPANGLLQYQIGSGAFADIAALAYPSNTSSGGSLSSIDLSGIAALRNVGAGTNVTFRIVNWGGTSAAGTWYVFDAASSSAPDFAVQGTVSPAVVPFADLAIDLTHTGNFTQGDTNAMYTVIVTNRGLASTTGTISVADTLPPGLKATSINGAGWSPNLGALTCTRSDALAPGASYPPIIVTVTVATNAQGSVTNTATVAGVGESNTTNNIASDPTTIIPLGPIQLWRLQWFGTAADSGSAADAALAPNGMPNLLDYALGLNPLVPATNPIVGEIDTGYLRLSVPRNPSATDVSFYVEIAAGVTTSAWTTNGTRVDIDTPELLQVHDKTPVAESPGGYIRLRVSRP